MESNEQLIIKIKAGIDVADNMLKLYENNKAMIHRIAKRYQGRAELEDLLQEGYLAMYDAVDGYDAEKGYKFLTYATHWINQRMMRYIQNNGIIRIPVHEGEKLQKYQKLVNTYRIQHGRKPTCEEIAYNMGVSPKMVIELEKAMQMQKLGSLDVYMTEEEGNLTIGGSIPDDVNIEEDVLNDVQQEQLKAVIWPLVDALPECQGKILRQRYQDNMTRKEIGDNIGITVEVVRTNENRAMRSLRLPDNSSILMSFLSDEKAYSMGLIGNGVERFNNTWTSSTEKAAIYGVLGHC